MGGIALSTVAFSTVFAFEKKETHDVPQSALDPQNFKKFKIQNITVVNHNTKIYTFALDSAQSLNLPVASAIVLKAIINGEEGMYIHFCSFCKIPK